MENKSLVKENNFSVDHVAVAVPDLDVAIEYYRDVLGFHLAERRETRGKKTGMISAVMRVGAFSIVLVQGVESDSQVSRFVDEFGPGVQHIAFSVNNIEKVVAAYRKQGLEFATSILTSPGLKQVFSKRNMDSGMMFEFIERTGEDGFTDDNVRQLFEQLEEADLI